MTNTLYNDIEKYSREEEEKGLEPFVCYTATCIGNTAAGSFYCIDQCFANVFAFFGSKINDKVLISLKKNSKANTRHSIPLGVVESVIEYADSVVSYDITDAEYIENKIA